MAVRNLLRLAPMAIVLLAACSQGGDEDTGARILSFASSSTLVRSGSTVTLTWKTASATSVRLTADPGGTLVEAAMAEGSFTSGALTAKTSFTLAVSDGSKTDMQTIVVDVDEAIPMIISFSAVPNPAPEGGMTVLSWAARGGKSLRILAEGVEIFTTTTETETGTLAASLRASPTNFVLEVKNSAGMANRALRVDAEGRPDILSFTADPQVLQMNTATVSVTWETVRARTVTLTANNVPVPDFPGTPRGTMVVRVMGSTTLELVAASAGGTASRQVLVSRNPAESEPNNDARSSTPIGNERVLGTIGTGTDVDWYQVTLTARTNLLVETSDGMGGCATDTELFLYGTDSVTLLGQDSGSGPVNPRGGPCAKIDPVRHAFAQDLAPGTYFLKLTGGQSATGAYTIDVMFLAPRCGDSIIERSLMEECDDGNVTPGDGCDAMCRFSGPSEAEPNDDTMNATVVMPIVRGGISSRADVDFYRVPVGPGNSVEAFVTGAGISSCDLGLQMELSLLGTDGMTELTRQIGTGPGPNCGRINPVQNQAAGRLSMGTYYLRVAAPTITSSVTYYLHVRIIPPGCGNGLIDEMEQCDDANMRSNDGCSSTCRLEPGTPLTPPGGRREINLGARPSYGAVQVMITMPGQSITASTSNGMNACPLDTKLTLRGSTFQELGTRRDGAIFPCASIRPRVDLWAQDLAVGTYYVVVENEVEEGGTIQLDVGVVNPRCGDGIRSMRTSPVEQCDDGNRNNGDGCSSTCQFESNVLMESEPNDSTDTADMVTLTTPGTSYAQGALSQGESDYYAVDLTRQATLVLRTQGDLADMNSCFGDTRLRLRDSMGNQLAVGEDISGTNFCSLIDGRTAMQSGAGSLPAGRYYIQVQAFNQFETVRAYVLSIQSL